MRRDAAIPITLRSVLRPSARIGRPYPGAFIVGTGRCGSTLLSDILRSHHDVLDVSEFLSSLNVRAFFPKRFDGAAFWSRLATPRPGIAASIPPNASEFAYPLGPGAQFTDDTLPPVLRVTLARMCDDCDGLFQELQPVITARPMADAAEHYTFLFNWLCQVLGKRMWVERSGASALMLPSILSGFPDAKIVHVVRDGREAALSMADHPAFRLLMTYRLRLGRTGLKMLDLGNLMGRSPWVLAAYPVLERLANQRRDAARIHPLSAYGAMWNTTVSRTLDALAMIPPRHQFALSYEGLVARPQPVVRALADFLEIDASEGWLHCAASRPAPRPLRFQNRTVAEREALQRTCRPMLERLGYPQMDGSVGRCEPEHRF